MQLAPSVVSRSRPAQSKDLRTEVRLAESLRRPAARRGASAATRRWMHTPWQVVPLVDDSHSARVARPLLVSWARPL